MAPIMKTLLFLTAALGAIANPIQGSPNSNGLAGRGSGSDLTCANVRCAYRCEMVDGKPKCIPKPAEPTPEPVLTCATVLCRTGFTCEMQDGKPRCVSQLEQCGKAQCPAGQVCCNPLCGTCVKPGDFCTMGSCPEPREAEAAPAGEKCGKNTCGSGEFCCNKSCGICAPKGGFCTTQFCTGTQDA
ncbi:hypothetical protein PG985_002535 [Apiospora marii]|uniref:uncharacterized protein n=1 Tax=Apiospora marii TaxID=335849 RepID=UPI0031303762